MSRLFFLVLSFFLLFPSFVFSAVCDYSQPSGTCGITSSSYYDCEEDLLVDFYAASGTVVWAPYTCSSGCCNTTYGLPVGTQFWQKGTAIFVLCLDGECSADPCADVSPKPWDDCGSTEQVKWDDINICKYHCDQGECEDEYMVAKQDCDNPRLISSLTCEYSCDCSDSVPAAQAACPYGYFMNADCSYDCKCCGDIQDDCIADCGGGSNVSFLQCEGSPDDVPVGECVVTLSTKCSCIVPPVRDPVPGVPDSGNPAPDPEQSSDRDKTCEELDDACPPSCQFWCNPDPDTGKSLKSDCDCKKDPADPSTPDTPGSADDGANGWLKEIETNSNRTADGVESVNVWLKAVKGDTAKIVENTDNIAENIRISAENDMKYFAVDRKSVFKDGSGESVFVNDQGGSYLKEITDMTTSGGSSVTLGDNIYDEEFDLVEEDSFSEGLSDYIATGIPLISYVEGMSFNLSSSSPVLNMVFWGRPVNVDFSVYTSVIDVAGNILFGLSIASGFILIIARIKS